MKEYLKDSAKVVEDVKSDGTYGLSSAEAKKRLERDGLNKLKEAKKELTKIRTSIEKTRVQLKQPYVDAGKEVDAFAKALTERVQFDSTMSAIDAGDYLELPEGSSAAAYMSDGSTMEEIFVVSCKDKTDASAVKIAMQELLDSQTQEAGRYQPEEAERLNNAVFATYGTCVVLCVTSDTDTANAVIKEYVG